MNSIFRLIPFLLLIALTPFQGKAFFQAPQHKAATLINKANKVEDPTVSLTYLNEAYQFIYELEDSIEANLYLDLGATHAKLSHTDSANYFLNQALNLATKNSYTSIEILALKTLGDVAKLANNFEQASNYYSLAFEKANTNNSKSEVIKSPVTTTNYWVKDALLFTLVILIVILVYLLLQQRKKITQTEGILKGEVNKLMTTSGLKFSLSIKALNEHINDALTQREYEVLCLVVTNKTNSLIAEKLFVSINTVKTHLKNIFEKLEVANRNEAIKKVISIKNIELK